MDSVRKAMVWAYSPTSARGSQTLCHSSGSSLYTVSQFFFTVYSNWHIIQFVIFTVGVLVPLLVVIVKFGVHLPTILRGFIFYVQISPIAVGFLPQDFNLRVDVVSDQFLFFSRLYQTSISPT